LQSCQHPLNKPGYILINLVTLHRSDHTFHTVTLAYLFFIVTLLVPSCGAISNMLGPSIILGLSTCALALNARYDGGYGYAYGGYDSKSLTTATLSSSKSLSKPTTAYSHVEQAPSVRPSKATQPYGYGHSASGVPYPTTGGNSTSVKPGPTGTPNCAPYWLEDIEHQGLASFNPNATSYKVFRNVKDYGAKGDGRTDDTVAIQRAITEGNRCTPGFCESSTTTPALVYFPGGTYVISSSLIDYYYTQVRYTVSVSV
jgi:glucan 1,3-beta-glucosidase